MMRGKPFIQETKVDERGELLRRLATALATKPIVQNSTSAEKLEAPKSTVQE